MNRVSRRVLLSLASLVALRPQTPAASAASAPNIVIIMLDDLDAASVSAMETVNQRIAAEGMTFPNCFATTPICGPSRASLLRGQYAHNHGVQRNTGDNAGFRAFDISGELKGDLRAQGREMAHVQVFAPDGNVPNSTMTWGVVVKNGLAYVNDIRTGLFIVRMEPRPASTLVP